VPAEYASVMLAEPTRRGSDHRLAQDGYALMEGFLDAADVLHVRREVDAALQAPTVPGCERPHNRLVPLRWDSPVVELILQDEERRHAVRVLTGGNDLRWISGYISVKEPATPALWWHQDWWCWDHSVSFRPAAPQIALLIYLTQTGRRTGALRLLPGSHRASTPLHASLPEAHADGPDLPAQHPAVADQPNQVTLSLRSGDAVLLDYRLLHGTHPNMATERRDAVLLSFAPSWRELPKDVQAHLIQHPALPTQDEDVAPTAGCAQLLPRFFGARADLAMNRNPPATFTVSD
jgi:ectoine hydroxylase-related dioxygenase (phytanoyl-CoA dioxygenase family)